MDIVDFPALSGAQLAEVARSDLGDAATQRKGKNVRPPGHL